jgi:hypothetical protein
MADGQQTPEFIKGTEGNMDYLVVAASDGAKIGVKFPVQYAPGKGIAVAMRIRVVPTESQKFNMQLWWQENFPKAIFPHDKVKLTATHVSITRAVGLMEGPVTDKDFLAQAEAVGAMDKVVLDIVGTITGMGDNMLATLKPTLQNLLETQMSVAIAGAATGPSAATPLTPDGKVVAIGAAGAITAGTSNVTTPQGQVFKPTIVGATQIPSEGDAGTTEEEATAGQDEAPAAVLPKAPDEDGAPFPESGQD